jgi:ArsR family transcriptional regulator
MNYSDYTGFFKALCDDNRLKIVDMLSCGEICACEILLELDITQSTNNAWWMNAFSTGCCCSRG